MTAGVALVLVSHSALIAEGLRDLAGQMAPGVTIVPAGGDPAGGLGTSVDLVTEAIEQAAAEDRQVLVLTDLGSAVLTTEMVLELLDEDVAARVRLAEAPLVEGAVVAAVEAAGGAGLDAVQSAAERAGGAPVAEPPAAPAAEAPAPAAEDPGAISGQVTVRNPLGLHARPAAILSRMMAGFDAAVQVNGVNAASVLELMQLGATQGQTLTLSATGPQARAAVDAFIGAVDEGFGEV
ncbi:dihydroxyacetone kinase phosphoryl donor subunit DhaM [Cellulomonas denverensis]|uniref:Phosphocarrier protein HPr n=1 Tax=Cellulomonas denverensis TaxID=264297 RepID=A0A7X6KVC1_9CELL|nr:dihydroxyacetone kinase phosphoryl donor subunit DhaM [Cellulomonas denverensis]NKY22785.1 PTS-dependent dihydroxyacetone kinase phosphotransferase subunit DhaM [Cellulomonas denverensis]GIG26249.1 PTS sugar transporter subunit IIA [Cellulomonas denverensis]